MTRTTTKAQLAEIMSVSIGAIDQWLRKGCPHEKRDGGHVFFDAGEVATWRQTQPTAGRPKSLHSEEMERARLMKELELVRRYKFQNDTEQGKYLPLVDVQRGRLERIAAVKSGLTTLVANLPPRLLGRDEPAMQVILHASIDELLREFAGDAPLDPPAAPAVPTAAPPVPPPATTPPATTPPGPTAPPVAITPTPAAATTTPPEVAPGPVPVG